ncbi:YciI family protein [Microlunatus panaciterrae]|uniref:YCII-related domain-containing protein n=1 Tax=Microlunatus panaciterrae TaxID=400768 RepID=A0ABS2RLP0_9ACTN|nr:YciI family protein [Microlunatus panaciterrae]MBM7799096.1 hypothetical protein [Microlunatus panaciterrae]
MKYMLLLCAEPEVAEQHLEEGCGSWTEDMRRRRILESSTGLRPPSDATTVRARDHQVLLGDGPFAETKEQIGGVCVIDCADLDEAIAVASQHPVARYGTIEIRPLYTP